MGHTDEVYLVNHFHEAVENGLIQAYFQPIYRSYTGKIFCAETLARWFGPDGEILPPDTFVPVMEQHNLIFQMDMEILRQACAFYKELSDRGTPLYSFSVNLSKLDFKNEDLFETITAILKKYDVPHDAIKLEITEGHMLEDIDAFQKSFKQFSDAGFSIWLDDFGSGYSSLNMLQNYSFDVIKFDMMFLKDLTVKGKNVLASLISMAKTLGIHTLVEGVETKEHKEFLEAIGCEAQQGFYYSKPIPKEELISLLDEKTAVPETMEDKIYWDRIGQLNFLSPNPLKEFTRSKVIQGETDNLFSSFDNSIALMECSQTQFNYIYATQGYLERVRDLGFDSLSGLEQAFSNQRSHQFLMVRKLILDALEKGTIQTVEYVNKDVYYRLSVQLLARKKGWVMMAVRLSTFDSEREVSTAREMLNYGSALFSTYELAVLIFPERNMSSRLYTANDLPIYDQESSISGSVEKFCKAEVAAPDQSRYMQFMDFKTMKGRIDSSPKKFIQSYFRMRWGEESNNWHTARVTEIPTYSEKAYLLTIQSVQGSGQQILDWTVNERPELLNIVNL